MLVSTYLVGKRNWSRVSANWDHICSNGWGCLRAMGRPVSSTVSRLVTANFQVPGEGQPYLIDSGTWSACESPLQVLQLYISVPIIRIQLSFGFFNCCVYSCMF